MRFLERFIHRVLFAAGMFLMAGIILCLLSLLHSCGPASPQQVAREKAAAREGEKITRANIAGTDKALREWNWDVPQKKKPAAQGKKGGAK